METSLPKKNISIIGSGGWGCALAILLNKNGHKIKVWSYSKTEADLINLNHENKEFLPGIEIPKAIFVSSDINEVLSAAEYIVIALPSKFMRETIKKISIPTEAKIISVTKGIEDQTFLRMSEIITEITKNNKVIALSGPTHAEEVARFLPTACVAASEDISLAREAQKLFNNNFFRVYSSSDIIGVELGGALKNIIAIAAGICDGLGFGDNTKSALISRGILEITRLGEKLGGKTKTFYGLSGLGDLITTCVSPHGRNRKAGILIGQGYSVPEAIEKVHMVVEGIINTKAAYNLAQKLNIEMPIVSEVYKILYEHKDIRQAVLDLIIRESKDE